MSDAPAYLSGKSRPHPPPTLAAQKQTSDAQAVTQDKVHDLLTGLPFWAMCAAVEAHIKARPNIHTKTLEMFSQSLSRHAWELDRNDPDRK